MDILSIGLLILIAVGAFFALRHMRRHPGCSGGCAGCTSECSRRK